MATKDLIQCPPVGDGTPLERIADRVAGVNPDFWLGAMLLVVLAPWVARLA